MKRHIGRVFASAPCSSAACVLAPSARTKGAGETLARLASKSRICDMIGTGSHRKEEHPEWTDLALSSDGHAGPITVPHMAADPPVLVLTAPKMLYNAAQERDRDQKAHVFSMTEVSVWDLAPK